jgi:hypothetical protein
MNLATGRSVPDAPTVLDAHRTSLARLMAARLVGATHASPAVRGTSDRYPVVRDPVAPGVRAGHREMTATPGLRKPVGQATTDP